VLSEIGVVGCGLIQDLSYNTSSFFLPTTQLQPLPSYFLKYISSRRTQNPSLKIQPLLYEKGKDILVTGRGGTQGSESSRLLHFLDNRVTDGGEAVSLRRRPPLTPGRVRVLISVRRLVDPRAIVRLVGLRQLKNPMTSTRLEPATLRLVAYCLNLLRYRELLNFYYTSVLKNNTYITVSKSLRL
jgi:hypothetical protein